MVFQQFELVNVIKRSSRMCPWDNIGLVRDMPACFHNAFAFGQMKKANIDTLWYFLAVFVAPELYVHLGGEYLSVQFLDNG